MTDYYNENKQHASYATPTKSINRSGSAVAHIPAHRISNFVQADARFYKEIYRENKNISQVGHSVPYDILKHDGSGVHGSADKQRLNPEETSPFKEQKDNVQAGYTVGSQSMSPMKKSNGNAMATRF